VWCGSNFSKAEINIGRSTLQKRVRFNEALAVDPYYVRVEVAYLYAKISLVSSSGHAKRWWHGGQAVESWGNGCEPEELKTLSRCVGDRQETFVDRRWSIEAASNGCLQFYHIPKVRLSGVWNIEKSKTVPDVRLYREVDQVEDPMRPRSSSSPGNQQILEHPYTQNYIKFKIYSKFRWKFYSKISVNQLEILKLWINCNLQLVLNSNFSFTWLYWFKLVSISYIQKKRYQQ